MNSATLHFPYHIYMKHMYLTIVAFFVAVTSVVTGSILPREYEPNGRYLVVLKPDANAEDVAFHSQFFTRFQLAKDAEKPQQQQQPQWFSFEENEKQIVGYSVEIPIQSTYILSTLRSDPSVDYVEDDAPVQIWEEDVVPDATQHDAPWGLARISHRSIPSIPDYVYNETDGDGSTVYVIDTGIRITHNDFEHRAKLGKMFLENPPDVFTDDNGHGTHCAGIVAGRTYGVCKHCRVVAVKVLDAFGSGTMSNIIAGIEYVVKQHKKHRRNTVINMSLGGMYTETVNRAVDAASAAGVHVVVAAGNSQDDACNYSPASAASAIAVGATTFTDSMASFSSYGNCTAIFAPGVDILSTWNRNDEAAMKLSGTSMASPHVAGVVAALLSRGHDLNPKKMKEFVKNLATRDVVQNIPSDLLTENLLLFNGMEDTSKRLSHEEL